MGMMRFLLPIALAFTLSGVGFGNDTIRTAADLSVETIDRMNFGRVFEIAECTVTAYPLSSALTCAVEDGTGAMIIHSEDRLPEMTRIKPGMRIRVRGTIRKGKKSLRPFADCEGITILGTEAKPAPIPISVEDCLGGRYDFRLITLRGQIQDIIRDEIDPGYRYLVVAQHGKTIYTPVRSTSAAFDHLFIGADVQIVGVCNPVDLGGRREIGRLLLPLGDGISICGPSAPSDIFSAPELGAFMRMRPQEIAMLGRHRTSGHVLAVWGNNSFLLRTKDGRNVRVQTADSRLPRYGDSVEAVGFPESDLYNINLSRAFWRLADDVPMRDEIPQDIRVRDIFTDEAGRTRFNPYVHGRTIRIRGIIRSLPESVNGDCRFLVESDAHIVPIDVRSNPSAMNGLDRGCDISVAGTCVMDIENWRHSNPFPTIRGFTLVIRKPNDISIVSRPPWYTPGRLLAVIGTLGACLFGILVWNLLLRKLAERRGHELAASAIAKAESDLKVYERTRLAVELHDAISQNLTGVSLAIHAADRIASAEGAMGVRPCLGLAARTLDSCRAELRNCLWDLRNLTLDEANLNDAIRNTLAPHIDGATLTVRFNVPRKLISDNTTHAILRILRELATNAVRHGKATHVNVAGCIDGDKLVFSVRDNGCGFIPTSAPGMDEGHFGLQGIRERINAFEGEMQIDSADGRGTKVTIALHIPQEIAT